MNSINRIENNNCIEKKTLHEEAEILSKENFTKIRGFQLKHSQKECVCVWMTKNSYFSRKIPIIEKKIFNEEQRNFE